MKKSDMEHIFFNFPKNIVLPTHKVKKILIPESGCDPK